MPTKANLVITVILVIALAVALIFGVKYLYLKYKIEPLAKDYCERQGQYLKSYILVGEPGYVQVNCYRERNGIDFINTSQDKLFEPDDPNYQLVRLFSF